jgi:hypothetical protein
MIEVGIKIEILRAKDEDKTYNFFWKAGFQVSHVDFETKVSKAGIEYKSAVVYFETWKNTDETRDIWASVSLGKLIYDDPFYWNVSRVENYN